MDGKNLFDVLVVYLEVYLVVKIIVEKNSKDLKVLIGNIEFLCIFCVVDYIDENFGVFIVIDIIKELDKLGCDLCLEFKIVIFVEGIYEVLDLEVGMVLEGVVFNVVNFGVFVDIGVY